MMLAKTVFAIGLLVATGALAQVAFPPGQPHSSGASGLSASDAAKLFLPYDAADALISATDYAGCIEFLDDSTYADSDGVSYLCPQSGGIWNDAASASAILHVASWTDLDGGAAVSSFDAYASGSGLTGNVNGRARAGNPVLAFDGTDYLLVSLASLDGMSIGNGTAEWFLLDGTRLQVLGSVLSGAGSVTAPAFGWSADADGTGTGFYRPTANEIGIAINGVQRALWDGGLRVNTGQAGGRFDVSGSGADPTGTNATCGSGHACARIVGADNRAADVEIRAGAANGGGGGNLFFSWADATDDKELWRIKQNATTLTVANMDEDDGTTVNATPISLEEDGDVVCGMDVYMTANRLLRTSSGFGSAYKTTSRESIVGTMDSAEVAENVVCFSEDVQAASQTNLVCVEGDGDIVPQGNKVSDLGSSANRFDLGYFDEIGIETGIAAYPALSLPDIGATNDPFGIVHTLAVYANTTGQDLLLAGDDDVLVSGADEILMRIGGSTVETFSATGSKSTQVTSGTPLTQRLPTAIAASGITLPTCSSSVDAGKMIYVDDTDDGSYGATCVCTANPSGSYSWFDIRLSSSCVDP
jgi:hypothetical protein